MTVGSSTPAEALAQPTGYRRDLYGRLEFAAYRPPAPWPTTPTRALLRTLLRGDPDLIGLLPADAYREPVMRLGRSRRGILLVSDPELVREILGGRTGEFPKNDLMVGALEPLVGEGLLASGGETWQRQRRMIEPAFAHMRIHRAFAQMRDAVDDYLPVLEASAASEDIIALDAAMSRLTADVMWRTIFSVPLHGEAAHAVFDAFARFQSSVANLDLGRLILDRPFARVPQRPQTLEACREIRSYLAARIAERTGAADAAHDDFAADLVAARDDETGSGFDEEALIDQLCVFFLAGHETTASSLTWTLFVLSQQPETLARVREEIDAVVGGQAVSFEHLRDLEWTRSVYREVLRLYPPVTFVPRVASSDCRIGAHRVRRGAMVMVCPWVVHRHTALWPHADRFDPTRMQRRARLPPGAYLPFGAGPRACTGASFATTEALLVLASLLRRFNIVPTDPASVRPVARLTTRPAEALRVRVVPRGEC